MDNAKALKEGAAKSTSFGISCRNRTGPTVTPNHPPVDMILGRNGVEGKVAVR